MFRAIALAASLFSVGAFACPNLAGNYTCTTSAGKNDVVITQRVDNGITYYSFNGEEFPADGLEYSFENQQLKNGNFSAWCSERGTVSVLNQNLRGDFYQNGNYAGLLDLNTHIYVHKNGLRLKYKGTLKYVTGALAEINEIAACNPK